MSLVAAGAAAPAFSLTAAVSGRTLDGASLRGKTVVFTFHGPRTADAAKEVGKAVRAKETDANKVVSISVVDLRAMAGLWRKVAEAQIKSTYERMAAKVPPPRDAADYVIICPDWDGAACKQFGVAEPDRTAAVVVVDGSGKVVGSTAAAPAELAQHAVEWLA